MKMVSWDGSWARCSQKMLNFFGQPSMCSNNANEMWNDRKDAMVSDLFVL